MDVLDAEDIGKIEHYKLTLTLRGQLNRHCNSVVDRILSLSAFLSVCNFQC